MSEQGKQYAAFIEAELKSENDLRSSINTRATSARTGSTGIVTLVLAMFAVLVKKDFTLTGWSKGLLAGALFALLVAAICALMALQPGKFRYTLGSSLADFLTSKWGEDEVDARNRTAYCNLIVLESLRIVSKRKVNYLRGAGVAQIVAVALLAFCTLAVLEIWPFLHPEPEQHLPNGGLTFHLSWAEPR
jgi:hypothetical protein